MSHITMIMCPDCRKRNPNLLVKLFMLRNDRSGSDTVELFCKQADCSYESWLSMDNLIRRMTLLENELQCYRDITHKWLK